MPASVPDKSSVIKGIVEAGAGFSEDSKLASDTVGMLPNAVLLLSEGAVALWLLSKG